MGSHSRDVVLDFERRTRGREAPARLRLAARREAPVVDAVGLGVDAFDALRCKEHAGVCVADDVVHGAASAAEVHGQFRACQSVLPVQEHDVSLRSHMLGGHAIVLDVVDVERVGLNAHVPHAQVGEASRPDVALFPALGLRDQAGVGRWVADALLGLCAGCRCVRAGSRACRCAACSSGRRLPLRRLPACGSVSARRRRGLWAWLSGEILRWDVARSLARLSASQACADRYPNRCCQADLRPSHGGARVTRDPREPGSARQCSLDRAP